MSRYSGGKAPFFDPETNAFEVRQVKGQCLDFQRIPFGLGAQLIGAYDLNVQACKARQSAMLFT